MDYEEESSFTHDLVVLVADADIRELLKSLLIRHEALGISAIDYDIVYNPMHDPGTARNHYELLQPYFTTHKYALVILDKDGCGYDDRSENIEQNIETILSSKGWSERSKAIVIDPEVEIWIWSDSPHVDHCLGWSGRSPKLREWLVHKGYLIEGNTKPDDPKEAFLKAIRFARKRNSAAIFGDLGKKVSLKRCQDSSFSRLRYTLSEWFSKEK